MRVVSIVLYLNLIYVISGLCSKSSRVPGLHIKKSPIVVDDIRHLHVRFGYETVFIFETIGNYTTPNKVLMNQGSGDYIDPVFSRTWTNNEKKYVLNYRELFWGSVGFVVEVNVKSVTSSTIQKSLVGGLERLCRPKHLEYFKKNLRYVLKRLTTVIRGGNVWMWVKKISKTEHIYFVIPSSNCTPCNVFTGECKDVLHYYSVIIKNDPYFYNTLKNCFINIF